MHGEPRMFHEPLLDLRVLVGGIVIADQMQLFAFGRLTLNLAQEVEPLAVTVVLITTGDDRTIKGIERREQGRGAVTLVVMSLGGRTTSLQGQPGLGAVECLHLALLVAAQNQRMLGRGIYKPTMSSSFSANFGSRETLKLSIK
jgi:hypothetical protein